MVSMLTFGGAEGGGQTESALFAIGSFCDLNGTLDTEAPFALMLLLSLSRIPIAAMAGGAVFGATCLGAAGLGTGITASTPDLVPFCSGGAGAAGGCLLGAAVLDRGSGAGTNSE